MEENENTPALWCNICRVSCCSTINLQSHFMGRRHRMAEEALRKKDEAPAGGEEAVAEPEEKAAGESDDGEEAAAEPSEGDLPWQSLAEAIEDTRGKEAALGLEYIYEFKHNGVVKYDCRLCELCVGRSHMYTHIIGQKHRTNYLSLHHPDVPVVNGYVSGSHGVKKRKLRDVCLELESKYGRKEINVVTGEYRSVAYSLAKKAADAIKDIDFTSDDPIQPVEEKPPAPIMQEDRTYTFVGLRDKHMAGLRMRGADVVAEPAAESGEEDGDGGDKPDKIEGAPFLNNKELIDFLDEFPVRTAEHVKFLLNVTKKLTGAMERHKVRQEERKKEEEERKKREEEERIRREEEERKRREEEELEKKRIEEEEKRKREEEERKRALYKPGAKLAFRIAAPPVEPNPLVSSDSLSSMQREFVSKGRPSKRSHDQLEEEMPETDVDGETPPEQQYQPEPDAFNPYADDDVDFFTPQQSDAISQLHEAPRVEPAKRWRSTKSPEPVEDAFQPKPFMRADSPPPHRTDSRGQDSQAPSKPGRQSRWGPEVSDIAPPRGQKPRGILKNADHGSSRAQEWSRNDAYAPPSDYKAQRNNAYAPPTDQNRYEASRNNAFAPPKEYGGPQNNAYAPSREQDRYRGARNVSSGHPRDQEHFAGPKNNPYAPQGNQNRFEGPRNNAYAPPSNLDRFEGPRNNAFAPPSNQDRFEGQRNDPYAPPSNQDRFEGQRNDAYAPPSNQNCFGGQRNDAYAPPSNQNRFGGQRNDAYAPPSNQNRFGGQRNDPYAPPSNQDRFGVSRNANAPQSSQDRFEEPRNHAFAPPREQERFEGSKNAYAPPRDFAAQRNAFAPPREAEHYGGSRNDDYAPPGDRDPYAPARAQNPQGLRNALAPARAQNPQGLRNALAPARAQNPQGLRNALAPARAQNPQGLRNAPAPPKAPFPHELVPSRAPASQGPMGNRTGFGPSRATNAPDFGRNPTASAPRGAHQPRDWSAPMPAAPRGPMNAAPRVAAFPGAKDAITAKFFDSIKSMDPSEVVSTLEKITVSNPAFKGIHVPSLVQYLKDSGKMKPGSM